MSNEVLIYDGGFKHKSVGKLGDFGVFVFTDDALEVYKTMKQKLKASFGVTGLIANLVTDDFEFEHETPDITLPYASMKEISKHNKFLQDPAIKITMDTDEDIILYIRPKKNIPAIAQKVQAVNQQVNLKQ